ncbi:unnamed protein product [Amaranthus hypochondriacus]
MGKSETNVVADCEIVKNTREIKKELKELILEIVEDNLNEEVILDTIDRTIQTLISLKELKINKKTKHSSKIHVLNVPEEFRCPISKEIMKDPVILSTGQTYDRPFIQKWLNEGNRTCPQTQQVLSHIELTPNHLVRELISQWCKDHGTELPPPQDISDGFVTDADRNNLNALLEKLSSTVPEQKNAAKEIRMLTRRMPSFRSFFGESTNALPQLLAPLTTLGSLTDHPDLQEDLVTTLLNLSIHDNNKKLIAEHPLVIPLLIESLKCGSIETKANAAAALFTLSALDENKILIADSGALKPLLDLVESGNESAMTDVTSAIFNLCKKRENRSKAVHEGAIKVIMNKLKERVFVSNLLSILALLSTNHRAIDELEEEESVRCLLSIIRESDCEADRENSIVIIYDVCGYSRYALRDVRNDEKDNKTLSKLTENGTSRAKRKANSILNKLNSSRHINYTHTA